MFGKKYPKIDELANQPKLMWWHVYGGWEQEPAYCPYCQEAHPHFGIFSGLTWLSPTDIYPPTGEVINKTTLDGREYLGSFDHEPTFSELEALVPSDGQTGGHTLHE